jgi:hypothetical protein
VDNPPPPAHPVDKPVDKLLCKVRGRALLLAPLHLTNFCLIIN